MTLEQMLKKIDWLELNPTPQGFRDLRLSLRQYAREISEAEKLLMLLSEDVEPRPQPGHKIRAGGDCRP
jgi:hypothetical protein